MSKYAGSPGRSIRSVNTCGCGLQRSPEMAFTPSTCSDPSSNSTLLTSATQSFSRKPGRRSEVPHDRLVVLWQQAEPDQLVHRPRPDMGRSDVADVVHVEAEQRA